MLHSIKRKLIASTLKTVNYTKVFKLINDLGYTAKKRGDKLHVTDKSNKLFKIYNRTDKIHGEILADIITKY